MFRLTKISEFVLLFCILVSIGSGCERKHTISTEPIGVLVLGDSLTEGYKVESTHSFPQILERQLHLEGYTGLTLINAGIKGSVSSSGLLRLQKFLRQDQPIDILIIELGANDGLRRMKLTDMEVNLSQMIKLAQSHDIKVLLAGIKLPVIPFGFEYSGNFHKVYERLAKQHDVSLIPHLLKGVNGRPSLNISDNIHPNAEGYKIVAKTVAKYLRPLL